MRRTIQPLPYNERCSKLLNCGHQCPSFCGEDCPQHLCHICSKEKDAQVDVLKFKTFSEIDPKKDPIVLLGYGHFFNGQTLDGAVGMKDVYTTDEKGNFTGLRDTSAELAVSVPSCPTCRRPIRQFATKRYNREVRLPEPLSGVCRTRKLRLGVGNVAQSAWCFHVTEFQRCPSISLPCVVAAHVLNTPSQLLLP